MPKLFKLLGREGAAKFTAAVLEKVDNEETGGYVRATGCLSLCQTGIGKASFPEKALVDGPPAAASQ
jgi:hypothetical protein